MDWSTFRTRFLASFIIFLLSAVGAAAQTGTTSIRGTVTDRSGAAVSGAKVTLTHVDQGLHRETSTNASGEYEFAVLPPGNYALTVEMTGFRKFEQKGLQLLVNTPATLNVRLEIGTTLETVEVSGTALTLNTSDATLGTAFNQTQISSLPFEGRDPVAILSLQPGVVTVADRDQVDVNADSRGGAVNGARSDQSNVTLDGVDDNDQLKGYAFTGALRATLDSIEEFRVTTSNSGADQGRSSGAQVALVTKSGGNDFHGTAYEYNRPTNLVANDYFHKHAELQNGEPNRPPRLLRNTFGGSFGGPIKKDRAFFFLSYEGQRTRESLQARHPVPSAALRDGVILYQCATPSACPGGSVAGLSGAQHSFSAGFNGLGPSQIASMDPNCTGNGTCPWGPGVDPNSIATMNQYPLPNSNQLGDGFNYQAFTFSAAAPSKLDTYVARFDYNLTQSQRLYARLGLQNDHAIPTSLANGINVGTNSGVSQFPGLPPAAVSTNNSKGIITGYAWTISPTKVNSFHYGFIRQGTGDNGSANQQFVRLRGLDLPVDTRRTTNVIVPVHNFTDDFTWTKGKHTLTFGGNWRFINDLRNSNESSFSDAITNAGFLPTTGFAGKNVSFDPSCDPTVNPSCTWSFPAVDSGFANAYNFPMTALAGIITEVDATYQRDKNGTNLPVGAFVQRHFRVNEVETYAQDSWRIEPNLTLTYGLRYSLLQPIYEVNGNQVEPSISLNDFFNKRMTGMVQGLSFAPNFSVDLAGPANGRQPLWGWDYKDIAPRLALAWSPGYKDGLLRSVFGGPGRSSLRIGAGRYYDHFGQGVINTFDRNGSFGLTTTIADAPGTVDPDTAPRYTGINNIPASLTPPGPTGPFPVTPPTADQLGGFAIYWGADDKLKTPYSYGFDVSFSRELPGGFVFEAAYVGRLGRRLLQERDLAQPLNLFDPQAKIGYNQALTALAQLYRTTSQGGQGITTDTFNPASLPAAVQQYWTDVMQPLEGPNPGNGGLGGAYSIGSCGSAKSTTNPVVAAFDLFCSGSLNETTPLFIWDLFGISDANNVSNCGKPAAPACNPAYFPKNGRFSFFQSQFASLYAWSSIGRSNYNSGQFSLRHQVTHGLTWNFNYTYSKAIDIGSNAERISLFEGFGFGSQVINAFQPGQLRGPSDYDTTHQINTSWVYELPFGHSKKWGSNWNRAFDAVLGGWAWSGLARWTSGFPFNVSNGFDFPTNWELTGNAVLNGPKPRTGAFSDCDGDPNVFAAMGQNCSNSAASANFIASTWRFPFPGESGDRNNLRGPGYFGIDMAVRKSWRFTERQALSFTWDVYNITNSVRFDAANILPAIDTSGSFGKYANTLTRPRVMEFALRYSF
jgi:hypothetical protein